MVLHFLRQFIHISDFGRSHVKLHTIWCPIGLRKFLYSISNITKTIEKNIYNFYKTSYDFKAYLVTSFVLNLYINISYKDISANRINIPSSFTPHKSLEVKSKIKISSTISRGNKCLQLFWKYNLTNILFACKWILLFFVTQFIDIKNQKFQQCRMIDCLM